MATRITVFAYHSAGIRFSGDILCSATNNYNYIQGWANGGYIAAVISYDRENGLLEVQSLPLAVTITTVSVDYI